MPPIDMRQIGLLMLLVLVYIGMTWEEKVDNQFCYDSIEMLNAIKSSPDNYQQLLNAFYPINRAKSSSVIIAYFTNYTDPFWGNRECLIEYISDINNQTSNPS